MRKRNFGVLLLALIIMPVVTLPNAYATTISKEQIDAFRAAKTVRIVVNQSDFMAKEVSLPFEDIAKRFLGHAGLRVVSDTEDYDLMVKIEAEGLAKAASYSPGGWLYTGASLSGSISLEAQGVRVLQKSFSGRVDPPFMTSSEYAKSPAKAPFRTAFEQPGSFKSTLIEVIFEVYGVNALILALKDESWRVRRNAAEALGKIKDPRAVEPLIAALKDKDSDDRRNAAEALGEIGTPAVEPLIAVLKDKDRRVREGAAEALGKIKDSRAVEPLIAALKNDEDWYVRMLAASALGKIKDPRAVEPLIAALDKDERLRRAATSALGKIKDPRAVEPLIAALKDKDSVVRRWAAKALGEITGKNFGEDPVKWQKWWEKNKEEFLKNR